MRVVIVMPLAEQTGGCEVCLRHVLQERAAHGIDWRVVFLEDGPMVEEFRALGVLVTTIPAGRLRQPHRFAATVLRLARHARRERADIVFSWMGKAHLYAGPAAKIAGIPAIWYQHGMPSIQNRMDRIQTRLPACGIIANSTTTARAQEALRPRRALRKVYCGVDLNQFDPSSLPSPKEARRRCGLPEEGLLIGIVGRLQRWKGIHTVIEAMPCIQSRYPAVRCVIVGGKHELEPDYPAFLNASIARLGLESSVLLAGRQTNVPEWMQAMDIVVHASDNEPFGLVVIEAMALGKPVIAGGAGGPSEIVTQGVDGLLTPYGDAEALAGAAWRYLEDPDFARQAGAAALVRAQEFSVPNYVRNLCEALHSLAREADHA